MARRTRRGAFAAVLALTIATLAACGNDSSPTTGSATSSPQSATTHTSRPAVGSRTSTTAGPSGTPRFAAVAVGEAKAATMLLPRPGDDGHVYVAERAGQVSRYALGGDGKLTRVGGVLLDISEQTSLESERGLLGLAFSADGDTIYVSSTDEHGDTRVASYDVAADGSIDASSRKVILTQEQPFPNHNGGDIVLGPDGKLWFGFGDGGAGDDPNNNAQNPRTLLGKLVRFTPGDKPEIVVSGLRNPWRYSFDPDGSLWIADVGQDQYEEIDHLAASEIDGANMGWSGYEGFHEHEDGNGRRPSNAIPPVFEYSHSDAGNCSITGGFTYRGKDMPSLRGAYLFADYCAGNVRAIVLGKDGKLDHEIDLHVHVDNPQSFGVDAKGEAYVLGAGDTIFRLTQR